MAGYGLKSFLIAQSLNQIEKAYGPNNSILDNCHVRVCFATNDERTARRVSDALGMATELRAMKNYAGHRLSPWLGHLMVSRQETARPLLTPGEVMQLPPDEELVLISGCSPIRAKKARYFEDQRFRERVLLPAKLGGFAGPRDRRNDWSGLHPATANVKEVRIPSSPQNGDSGDDQANSGIRREPGLLQHEEVAPELAPARPEFQFADDEPDDEVQRATTLRKQAANIARCPSSDDLRLVRRFVKGGSGSSGLEFKRPATDAASVGWRWLHA
jgi:type IV secretion system protein VirD4